MFPLSTDASNNEQETGESQNLTELIMSWEKNSRVKGNPRPAAIQVKFSEDLANYISTGVDPTGRYAKPPTPKEKIGIALGYAFIICIMIVGILSGGVGRKLFEELMWLIQGGN